MARKHGKEDPPVTVEEFDTSLGLLLVKERGIRVDYYIAGTERELLALNLRSLEENGSQWGEEYAMLTARGSLRLLGLLETAWDDEGSLTLGVFSIDGSLVGGLRHSPAKISGPQQRVERTFKSIEKVFSRLPKS